MTAIQKTEFVIGSGNVDGSKKYTPRPATVNSVKGRIWVRRELQDGGWIHQGSVFVRANAAEIEVHATVDEALS